MSDESPGSPSERRQVTVVFCDIVDSTGLSQRCDPEDLQDVLLEFQALTTRQIEDAGGKVINYIGDGIRAQFGYPMTSENEAESAVRASLAILQAMQTLGARTTAVLGEAIRVRVGVHTGFAVIGKAGPGHVHSATEIVGLTPNIAARLQEIGAPNSIMVSAATCRLLGRKFRLRPLGLRPLKGLATKIDVAEVLGEEIDDGIVDRIRRKTSTPLVDRTAEVAQLLQSWELARAGSGQTVQIVGEAGIGKSRVALELLAHIDPSENAIFILQGSAHHQNVPLYPIIRHIEQRIGFSQSESLDSRVLRLGRFMARNASRDEERTWLIGNLLGLPIPCPRVFDNLDAQEIRRRTRESVISLLMSHAPDRASVILVEDFQWADPSTKEVVEHIAARILDAAALLLITSRIDITELASFARRITSIVPQRLADDHSRNLAGYIIRERFSSKLLEEIVTRSDGVPLFVEELAAALLETGHLNADARSVTADNAGVPPALFDSLMIRLDRLGAAKSIAQIASVMGRTFSHELLTAVAIEHRGILDAALVRLLDTGLINVEERDTFALYSFKHALVRDVAYYSMLRRQRRELHARLADAIETQFPVLAAEDPDYLAQHLSEGGLLVRAVQVWLKAARRSAERSANLEAIAQLRAALDQIDKLPAGPDRDDVELNAQIALIPPRSRCTAMQPKPLPKRVIGRSISVGGCGLIRASFLRSMHAGPTAGLPARWPRH